MAAPYVIRDDAGYWHSYELPTAGLGPVGVSLIASTHKGDRVQT